MALGDVDRRKVAEIREEIRQLGARELWTADEVTASAPHEGVALLFVNALDDCAEHFARPALALALQHDRIPEKVLVVFAGQSLEATALARSFFKGYFPTAPQIGLLVNGDVVYMCDRDDMQKRLRDADKIAQELVAAFDKHCPEAQ